MTSPGAALSRHRTKIALWLAVAEGLLTLVGLFPHLLVYALAVAAIALWFGVGRAAAPGPGRQLAWIFAVAQCATVLVPVVWFFTKWAAITVIVLVALVALIYLFTERNPG